MPRTVDKFPPKDRKITTSWYPDQWFVAQWSDEQQSFVTCWDGTAVRLPEEWIEYELWIVTVDGEDRHEYLFLKSALSMIEFLARTGQRLGLYQKE